MALSQVLNQIPHATLVLPVICLLAVFAVKALLQYFSPQARRLRHLPVVSEKDDAQLRKSVQQAYHKYSKAGEFYKINEDYHQLIIIPPKFMSEIKALPETKLSFSEEIHERYNGELTAMGRFEPSFIKTVSGDLTKRISHIFPELIEETEYAFEGFDRDANGSFSIAMLPAAQRIMALLSSRVFVGSPLCHDEHWLEAMITHTNNTFSTSEKVWKYPQMLRPYIAPYLKEFKKMTANKTEVERMLAPLISARQKAAFADDADDFDDILTRLIQHAPANKKADVSYHAHNQLEMSAAGIHTTAQMLTHMIYNFAAYPEHIPELREELQEVLCSGGDLFITKPALAKLIKLDSFMKETQRTDPLGILSMNRKIMSPTGLTLSNGLHIPYGTFTAMNSYHMVQDPALYVDPEKFDGFRFSKLAEKGGANSTKHQFTTVNPEFAAFGQGTHSCPGRFFAAAEIKVVLIYILANYDITFATGQTRPANATRGILQGPNGQAKVVFTPREKTWTLIGDSE